MNARFILNSFKLTRRSSVQFSKYSSVNITPRSPSNVFARNVMIERGSYVLWPETLLKFDATSAMTVASQEQEMKNAQRLSAFREFIEKAQHENLDLRAEENSRIFQEIQAEMPNFNDEQLVYILTSLLKLSAKPARFKKGPIADIRDGLSPAIESRCWEWSINQLLLIADIWYSLPHKGETKLIGTVCDILSEHVSSMTPAQLVQTLFYINTRKSATKNMPAIEEHLKSTIHQLSLEEVSIALSGFIMANRDISNPKLYSDIFWKLLDGNFSDVSEFAIFLSPFLKMLRRSKIPIHEIFLDELLHKLHRNRLNWSRYSPTHIARFASTLRNCNQDLLETIAVQSLENLEGLRTKDIGIISYALMAFNFRSETGVDEQLFKAMLDILPSHSKAIEKHPESLASCLYNLAVRGFYNPDLIGHVLETAKCTKSAALSYSKQLLFLDAYTTINLSGIYNGPRLDENTKSALVKTWCIQMSDLNTRKEQSDVHKVLLGALHTVQNLKLHYKLVQAIPYFRMPNIFIVMHSTDKRSVDKVENFPRKLGRQIVCAEKLTGSDPNLITAAIIIAGPRHYVLKDNVLEFAGDFQIKLDQMKLLGIRPVVIPYFEWKTIIPAKRNNYVEHKISTVLNNLS